MLTCLQEKLSTLQGYWSRFDDRCDDRAPIVSPERSRPRRNPRLCVWLHCHLGCQHGILQAEARQGGISQTADGPLPHADSIPICFFVPTDNEEGEERTPRAAPRAKVPSRDDPANTQTTRRARRRAEWRWTAQLSFAHLDTKSRFREVGFSVGQSRALADVGADGACQRAWGLSLEIESTPLLLRRPRCRAVTSPLEPLFPLLKLFASSI